MEQNMVLNHF